MTKTPYSLDQFAKELELVIRRIQERSDQEELTTARSVMEELKPLVQKLLHSS